MIETITDRVEVNIPTHLDAICAARGQAKRMGITELISFAVINNPEEAIEKAKARIDEQNAEALEASQRDPKVPNTQSRFLLVHGDGLLEVYPPYSSEQQNQEAELLGNVWGAAVATPAAFVPKH